MKKILMILFLFSTLSYAFEVSPNIKFKTIETQRFLVIVDETKLDVGFYVAGQLERAHKALAPYFAQLPKKTTVVINDKTDLTNGFATKIPYAHIMIYPVLPSTMESLADYGDWAFELVAHEYTHILTFEGYRSFYKYLRPVFGNIISPNALMPRWWKEGVAVYMETFLSNGGRLRSNYQDSLLRSFVLTDELGNFKIPEINEFLDTWPEGNRPYFFGSLIWAQMTKEEGPMIVKQLHDRQAGRVPFFINAPAEDYLGSDYEKFFEDTLFSVEEKAIKQIDSLKQIPEIISIPLDKNSKYSYSPKISPDGKKLAYLSVTYREKKIVKVIERNKKNNFQLLDESQIDNTNTIDDIYQSTDDENDGPIAGIIQRIEWFPDSKKLVYDKVDSNSVGESFSDLFLYDSEKQTTERLTKDARAREACVSVDGKQLVYVSLSALKTQLKLMDLATKQVKDLWSSAIQERISHPIFLNSNTVLFSLRQPTTKESLYSLDLNTLSLKPYILDQAEVRFPLSTKDTVYFSSTQNGVRNIYQKSKSSGKITPITHLYTGSSTFDIDPISGDLYFTKLTSKGFQINISNTVDLEKTPQQLPRITNIQSQQFPYKQQEISQDKGANFSTKDYSGLGYLWPQYWIPFVASSSSDNRFLVQAQTSGFDPLKRHIYNLDATYDSATSKMWFNGTYLNQSFNTKFGLNYNQYSTYYVSPSTLATFNQRSVFFQPNIWSLNKNGSVQVALKQISTVSSANVYERQGIGFLYSYSDLERTNSLPYPYEGQSYYLGFNQFIKSSVHKEQTQFLLGTNQNWPDLLMDNHVIQLKLDALYSNNKISSILGASTTTLYLNQDPLTPYFLMRGYQQGQFVGEIMINPKFEYRFPMREVNRGNGTQPIFFRRIHGAVILDGVALEGLAYNQTEKRFVSDISTNQSFWSTGFEFRFDINLAYQLPLTAIVGLYNPLSGSYGGNSALTTHFQVGSFF